MIPVYRFLICSNSTLENVSSDLMRECYPIYDDKLAIKYAKENNYKFFRKSLDGKLKFVKDDYDYIMAASLDSYNIVHIEKSNDEGKTWSTYFEGYFRKTDCSINTIDKIIEVKLSTLDMYDKLVAGLDNEYNLIALAPEIVQIQMAKNPILQIYSPSESVVSSYSHGGIYWEQECETISDTTVLNKEHGFYLYKDYRFKVAETAEGQVIILNHISGSRYDGSYIAYGGAILRYDGFNDNINIVSSDGEILYTLKRADVNETGLWRTYTGVTTVRVTKDSIEKSFYTRIVHDNQNSGTTNINIKNKTQFGDFHNYRYATPYDLSDDLRLWPFADISSEPTEFGQRQPGEYYKYPQVPASTGLGPWFPVSKTTWGMASFWLSDPFILDAMQQFLVSEFTLKHAYPLASCLDKLIKEVDSRLVHKNVEAYSRFFYSSYNPLSGDSYQLFIAPITNVLEGEYDQPAQKMPITLKNIFEMLENCFRVYWFLDGDKLRLEHITFFENGGKYYENTAIQLDTTRLIHPRSKKPWSNLENEYEYDLDNEPSRYEFSWADDSSKPFEGYPLEIHANYLKGKTEKVQINKFSTDIDFMLANPGDFSKDNIALLGAPYISAFAAGFSGMNISLAPGEVSILDLNASLFESFARTCIFSFDTTTDLAIFLQDNENEDIAANIQPANTCLTWEVKKGAAKVRIRNIGQTTTKFIAHKNSITLTGLARVSTARVLVKEKYETARIEYILQNGYLSFADLVPKYFTRNLPSLSATVNNETLQELILSGIWNLPEDLRPGKFKKQKISIPIGKNDPETNKLIGTSLGNGTIEEMKINLSSRLAEITLRHDLEPKNYDTEE